MYDNPFAGSNPRNQVELVQLRTPIANVAGQKYSIAQPVWFGAKSSLQYKNATILGAACANWPSLVMGSFTVSQLETWAYDVSPTGSAGLVPGDSGGPGYVNMSGTNYLVGTTVAVDSLTCKTQGGSQHDLTEVQAWFDDTLFDHPRVIQAGADAYAQAMTPTGAVATFRWGNTVYYSSCTREPCDARGNWSPPVPAWTTASPSMAPSIAFDPPDSQIFVNMADGSTFALHVSSNNQVVGQQYLGGTCTSPIAADTRPGTSPPILDIACLGQDMTVYTNHRASGAWRGFYSLGVPPPRLKAGAAPAIVSTDANTTWVFAVGADGAVWLRKGVSGSGWSAWSSLGGGGVAQVAAASYGPSRLDVVAVTSQGAMYHRVADPLWTPNWLPITRGNWSAAAPPFAASYNSHLGRLNIGSVGSGNAWVQRYSDWTPGPMTSPYDPNTPYDPTEGGNDWAPPNLPKAQCVGSWVTGASQSLSHVPHVVQCNSRATPAGYFIGTQDITAGDSQPSPYSWWDWDFGYYKGECPRNQGGAVSGISLTATGRIGKIACRNGAPAGNPNGNSQCVVENFYNGDARGNPWTNDWDGGFFKGDCPPAMYLRGLSSDPVSGAPHALLCCY
jgi:hypothetical protein